MVLPGMTLSHTHTHTHTHTASSVRAGGIMSGEPSQDNENKTDKVSVFLKPNEKDSYKQTSKFRVNKKVTKLTE